LRRIKVLKSGEVIVDSYQPHSFAKNQDHSNSVELLDRLRQISSKKMVNTEVLKMILDEIDDKK